MTVDSSARALRETEPEVGTEERGNQGATSGDTDLAGQGGGGGGMAGEGRMGGAAKRGA